MSNFLSGMRMLYSHGQHSEHGLTIIRREYAKTHEPLPYIADIQAAGIEPPKTVISKPPQLVKATTIPSEVKRH